MIQLRFWQSIVLSCLDGWCFFVEPIEKYNFCPKVVFDLVAVRPPVRRRRRRPSVRRRTGILCCIMLYHGMLCYIMLYHGILCYIMLWYIMLYHGVLCYIMLCYFTVYYILIEKNHPLRIS